MTEAVRQNSKGASVSRNSNSDGKENPLAKEQREILLQFSRYTRLNNLLTPPQRKYLYTGGKFNEWYPHLHGKLVGTINTLSPLVENHELSDELAVIQGVLKQNDTNTPNETRINYESLIAKGESGEREFKSSFRFDVDNNRVDKDLQLQIAKAVTGFLNTRDGMVLIGVADNGAILGLDNDIKNFKETKHQNIDYFEQNLLSFLRNVLGDIVIDCLTIDCPMINGKNIAVITVKNSETPITINFSNYKNKSGKRDKFENKLFVRQGNATVDLTPIEAARYALRSFQSE